MVVFRFEKWLSTRFYTDLYIIASFHAIVPAKIASNHAIMKACMYAKTMNLKSKYKFASVIKGLRGDMSKSAFARSLGVSHTAISNWEDAQHIPDCTTLSKIAKRAGYSLDSFVAFLEDKSLSNPLPVDQILNQVNAMPPKDLALIVKACTDRFHILSELAY